MCPLKGWRHLVNYFFQLLFCFRESKLIPNDVEQTYRLLQHLVEADEHKTAIEYVSWMARQYLHSFLVNCLLTRSIYFYYILYVLVSWALDLIDYLLSSVLCHYQLGHLTHKIAPKCQKNESSRTLSTTILIVLLTHWFNCFGLLCCIRYGTVMICDISRYTQQNRGGGDKQAHRVIH